MAVDARNGNLYAVWMDARFDGGLFLVDHDNIAFSQSTNGGATWSAPIKVNKTPTGEPNYDQQAFTPSVDVDGDGTVTVSYYDFRNNTASPAALDTDYFAVSCESASENCASAASWEEERITPASLDIRRARSPPATSSVTTWGWTTTAPTSRRCSARRSGKTTPASTSAGWRRSQPARGAMGPREPVASPAPAQRRNSRRCPPANRDRRRLG